MKRAPTKADRGKKRKAAARPRAVQRKRRGDFPVVGIGASAGGLQAIEKFLGRVPASCNMAFIVIQHQDPDHKGLLAELLPRATSMKVSLVKDRTRVERNQVYVAPADMDMSILHGKLHLFEPSSPRRLRLPIDFFFRSLAADQGERGAGVVLSGMGTDGTLGLKAIKEAGGLVAVQSPPTARFDCMPRSAKDTGLADIVAPPEELVEKIAGYFAHAGRIARLAPLDASGSRTALEKIVILLREKTGNDFSLYKTSSLCRRVERRMGLLQIDKISRYVRFLQDNAQERDLLFNELLIGVTGFFRDPDAWKELGERALPALFASRPDGGRLRAWVAGCSTGEEAYSLTITVKEALERARPKAEFTLQVFATDLDRPALEKARRGVYPANVAADVSPSRLRRFFFKEDDGSFRVTREIRELVTFAPQNLMIDPPFTRLDILVCRNLFIYLTQDLQKRLLPLFHFALNPGGLLFLGAAESASGFEELFDALHERWRIFRRREIPSRLRPARIHVTPAARDRQAAEGASGRAAPELQALVDRLILQRFGPSAVVATAKGDIVYISGRTGKYLEPAAGKANWNIFAMAREGLRHELHGAFSQALRQNEAVLLRGLRVRTDGDQQVVDVTVQALDEPETLRGMLCAVFQHAPARIDAGTPSATRRSRRNAFPARDVEINNLRAQLKALHEEMLTSREELQASNEELTTSKEEMQSLNEELLTVNAELKAKVDELSRANDDIKNLLDSTDIAALFLDPELNIRRFTTQATRIIKLIATDVGRPITDLATDLDYPELAQDVKGVLESLVPVEKPVRTHDGRWFSARILPYSTRHKRIDGAVITLSDISAFKKLEAELRRAADDVTARELERTAELKDMRRLYELGAGLWKETKLDPLLGQVLEASMGLLGADKGVVQLYDEAENALKIVASAGFDRKFLDRFKIVGAGSDHVCSAAMARRARVVVEDLRVDPGFRELRPVATAHGYVAVQSTPLFDQEGRLGGILSTYWAKPHRPSERELRLLDLYAQLAERAINRARMAESSRRARGGRGCDGGRR